MLQINASENCDSFLLRLTLLFVLNVFILNVQKVINAVHFYLNFSQRRKKYQISLQEYYTTT